VIKGDNRVYEVLSERVYRNYALPDTPVEHIYAWNLPRLKEIRARVDPDDIMLRAGGYKIV